MGREVQPHALGFFGRDYPVFRLGALTVKAIHKYVEMVGVKEKDGKPAYIKLQGSTSTSEDYRVALKFADTTDPKKQLVLFVICIHNYFSYPGLRMNSDTFSAHPEEREVLLMEGAPVIFMGSEEFFIDNSLTGQPFWDSLNGKKITVIYMFHSRN